ncbi:hypothetical protein OG555_04485 [Kribbella sp. NBC_01484]|uniref:hypothetical protein n=1 Tax=Kribbella sp. NBC_01484 TaxID=2903579 RepID=UPI002E37F003|nr:hypothetical protein [Kribbella sp. NBC_01484]
MFTVPHGHSLSAGNGTPAFLWQRAPLGFHALDVVAPLMFLILMIWLGIARLRTSSAIRSE